MFTFPKRRYHKALVKLSSSVKSGECLECVALQTIPTPQNHKLWMCWGNRVHEHQLSCAHTPFFVTFSLRKGLVVCPSNEFFIFSRCSCYSFTNQYSQLYNVWHSLLLIHIVHSYGYQGFWERVLWRGYTFHWNYSCLYKCCLFSSSLRSLSNIFIWISVVFILCHNVFWKMCISVKMEKTILKYIYRCRLTKTLDKYQ